MEGEFFFAHQRQEEVKIMSSVRSVIQATAIIIEMAAKIAIVACLFFPWLIGALR